MSKPVTVPLLSRCRQHMTAFGLMLCCPLTTRREGCPFEVPIDDARESAVLADQVKSLDWRALRAQARGRISDAELSAVRAKATALIGRQGQDL